MNHLQFNTEMGTVFRILAIQDKQISILCGIIAGNDSDIPLRIAKGNVERLAGLFAFWFNSSVYADQAHRLTSSSFSRQKLRRAPLTR